MEGEAESIWYRQAQGVLDTSPNLTILGVQQNYMNVIARILLRLAAGWLGNSRILHRRPQVLRQVPNMSSCGVPDCRAAAGWAARSLSDSSAGDPHISFSKVQSLAK